VRAELVDLLTRYLTPKTGRPCYAGAVVLVSVRGRTVVHEPLGYALRYRSDTDELPDAERVPMRPDAIFDLASITKVFTALVALREADAGRLDLAAPVADYLPEFGRAGVTVAMLLAHTSGLPALLHSTDAELPPGTVFRYSDIGLITLGRLLERVGGVPLDDLVRRHVTDPLGLRDTRFNPDADPERMVATEAKPGRGLVRGVVHDENAYAMGGVAGHAGLFSTAADLARLGEFLAGDVLAGDGTRLLRPETMALLRTDANPGLPSIDPEHRPGRAAHGLGVELNQPWYMGRLASPVTMGHTGFTGTSIVVEPARRIVVVLLTNRIHPDRAWAGINPVREAVATIAAGTPPE